MAFKPTGQLYSGQSRGFDVHRLSNCVPLHTGLACTITDDTDATAGTYEHLLPLY